MISRLLTWHAVGATLLALSLAALASSRETLDQAIAAYTEAQTATQRDARLAGFRRAQRLFEHAIQQGAKSADLYANLGTAALQAEHLGPAILAFRQALVLDPDHARAQQNLIHARTLLPAWVPKPQQEGVLDSFFFWHHSLSPGEQAGLGALFFLLGALLLAIAIRWNMPLLRNLTVLPLLAWLVLVSSALIGARADTTVPAVLIAPETIARAADSPNAPARYAEPLPGGTEVEILETREHWVRIGLANGRDAWVQRASLARVDL